MSTTTNLDTLKINYLTQAQYDTALANNEINENELYFTENNNIDVALDMVSLRPNTTLTLNTTFQKLPYKTIISRISNGGIYVAEGTFTCKKDGFIEISASYYYSGATAGTTLAYLYVTKNGSTIHGAAERAASTSDYISLPAFVEEVKAGDVIEFTGKTSSGTLLFAQGGIDISRATIKYLETVSVQKNTTHNYNFDIDMIYPVGSIYMSVNNVSPETFIPGTVWESLTNRFLIGAGDTYGGGAKGGETTHTLTVNEIPSHRHQESTNNFAWKANSSILQKGTSWNASTNQTLYTGYTGGGKAHNNMPPYLAVYMWKRTA